MTTSDIITEGVYEAQDRLLQQTLAFIKQNWPDLYESLDPLRIAGWDEEIAGGDGRSAEEIRADIFQHVVTEERVEAYVRDAFESRGLGIGIGDESEEERIARITGSLMDGSRRFNELNETLDGQAGITTGGDGTDPGGTDLGDPPAGSGGGALGILPGGTLVQITRDGQDSLWAMVYVVDGIQHVYTFDSYDSVLKMLGDDALTNKAYGYGSLDITEDSLHDDNTWLFGDAAMFEGQEGSYATWWEGIKREAVLDAGGGGSTTIADYYNDPEIAALIARAAQEEWTPERLQAAIRETKYYQNVLYPGIKTFLDQGIANPEQAYVTYMNNVGESLGALGYEKDADGTWKSQMAAMLEAGITADEFNSFAPVFIRAEQSQEFAATLNEWTQNDLGITLDFEDWFEVLEGSTTAEMDAVVEKATIQFQADLADTQLDRATIERLAGLTQLSEQQMTIAFTNAEQSLLAVGQADLARYGLTQEALVAAAFGTDSAGADPLSLGGGEFTATEIRKRARKAATELGIQDDRKSQFFVGFDSFGSPTRKGLAVASPEAG